MTRKLIAFAVSFALTLCGIATAQNQQSWGSMALMRAGAISQNTFSDGLINFWAGYSTTNDMGPRQQNLLPTGGSPISSADGWDFGTSTNAWLITGPLSKTNMYTISIWSKPDTNAMTSHASGGWMLRDALGALKLQLTWNKASKKYIAEFYTSTYHDLYSATIPIQLTWYHVAFVVDGSISNASLYVNGVLETSSNFVGNVSYQSVGNCEFGLYASGGAGAKYHGSMDRFRVYSEAKSSNYVNSLYLYEKGLKGL